MVQPPFIYDFSDMPASFSPLPTRKFHHFRGNQGAENHAPEIDESIEDHVHDGDTVHAVLEIETHIQNSQENQRPASGRENRRSLRPAFQAK
jgi:hypothetical protein